MKSVFSFLFMILCYQCMYSQKVNLAEIAQNQIIFNVRLHDEVNDSINFSNNLTDFRLFSFDEFPEYKNFLKTEYKGLPEHDSIEFYGNSRRSTQFYYHLYKSGFYSVEHFSNIYNTRKLDTLYQSKVKLRESLILIVGFHKKKEFIIADTNRNKDFSDDVKYEYDITFRENALDSIKVLNEKVMSTLVYEDCTNGIIEKYSRKFILYPDINSTFSYDCTKKDREYYSLIHFKDYWKGETTINEQEIEFYYFPSFGNFRGVIYVKPKNNSFSKTDAEFNNQYLYNIYDTISIAGSTFIIDSIDRDLSKLVLKQIGTYSNNFGNVVGTYLMDLQLFNLNNQSTLNTKDIIGKKKYTLIDFWGTWCAPCKAMTPKLKDLEQNFSAKINILSIAVEDEPIIPKDYMIHNKLNWFNCFIQKKSKYCETVTKELNIQFYPTFILLDEKGKIVLKGGTETFNEILNLINK